MKGCGLALFTENEICPRTFDTQVAYRDPRAYRAATSLITYCGGRVGIQYAFLIGRSAIWSTREVAVIACGSDICSLWLVGSLNPHRHVIKKLSCAPETHTTST